jgi:hypothetical protein
MANAIVVDDRSRGITAQFCVRVGTLPLSRQVSMPSR